MDTVDCFIRLESDAVAHLQARLVAGAPPARVELEYNLFDFEIDFESGTVTVGDICNLCADPQRDDDFSVTVPLEQLSRRLAEALDPPVPEALPALTRLWRRVQELGRGRTARS